MRKLIVTRHPAAVAFIRATSPEFANAPVLASATAEDVRGAEVAGVLPLHLAAQAGKMLAIEFAGEAPRGAEYTLADMMSAGAQLVEYRVFSGPAWDRIYTDWCRHANGPVDVAAVCRTTV